MTVEFINGMYYEASMTYKGKKIYGNGTTALTAISNALFFLANALIIQ